MKKVIPISITIPIVLSVIIVVSRGEPLIVVSRGELLVAPLIAMSFLIAVGSLPGIFLSLITLIPTIRKRARSNLTGRVMTILVVMTLSVVIFFSALERGDAEFHYIYIPSMVLEKLDDDPYKEILEFRMEYEYEEKRSAIIRETWIRLMIPPFLRQRCYTSEQDICEFVDQFPKNGEVMSYDYYLRGVAFALAHSLLGGMFAWHFTRSESPQDIVIETS